MDTLQCEGRRDCTLLSPFNIPFPLPPNAPPSCLKIIQETCCNLWEPQETKQRIVD